MGHHIDEEGRFQSDKYPELGPDKVVVDLSDPEAWEGMMHLARSYESRDTGFAADMVKRLDDLRPPAIIAMRDQSDIDELIYEVNSARFLGAATCGSAEVRGPAIRALLRASLINLEEFEAVVAELDGLSSPAAAVAKKLRELVLAGRPGDEELHAQERHPAFEYETRGSGLSPTGAGWERNTARSDGFGNSEHYSYWRRRRPPGERKGAGA